MKIHLSKKTKCILAIQLVVVLLVCFVIASDYLNMSENGGTPDVTPEGSELTGSNWMSYVDGTTSLSYISIPGTNNSCARYVFPSYFMRCQNTSISQQLKNGYRYLDLHVAIADDEGTAVLVMKNGTASCRTKKSWFSDEIYFTDVLSNIYSFLEKNPTEAVIICVNIENEDDSISDIQRLLYQQIDANPDSWYLSNSIPTLDDVRGKIVLCTSFEDELGLGENRSGIKLIWDDQGETTAVETPYELYSLNDTQGFWVQDRYNYSADDKVIALIDGLDNCLATDDAFFLNFASTSGNRVFGHILKYSTAINQALLEYDFQADTCYGIVIVDFGSAELAYTIYSTNTLEE